MNSLDLQYEDDSFDAIFSSTSIEHFGSLDDVRRSADEMFRVLRPGGVLTLSTEFRLAGPPPGLPGILMFDRDQLADRIIGKLGCSPMSPLDLAVSSATRRTAMRFDDAAVDLRRHVSRRGNLLLHELEWSRYPQIVVRLGDLAWTSVHLALRKHA
jgi:ubiquinone/menaquinone biosynthesis C-methylase UbiE